MDTSDPRFPRLVELLGSNLGNEAWRRASYILLESHVDHVKAEHGEQATEKGVEALRETLSGMDDRSLAFLLVHSGYIPDHYLPDSSEETLHTKLTETLVAEWGARFGLDATIQTEKASKEDVTFRDSGKVIVCDAKSYRLGRSQAAPNVKDAIKQGDYQKWLSSYPESDREGGLVTFPSRHDWKRASDVYSYSSNADDPILLLFYEHLAFLLLNKDVFLEHQSISRVLQAYPEVFSNGHSKERDAYWASINEYLNGLVGEGQDLNQFIKDAQLIVDDAVNWAIQRIENMIEEKVATIKGEVEALPVAALLERLLQSESNESTKELFRMLGNIKRFRL